MKLGRKAGIGLFLIILLAVFAVAFEVFGWDNETYWMLAKIGLGIFGVYAGANTILTETDIFKNKSGGDKNV